MQEQTCNPGQERPQCNYNDPGSLDQLCKKNVDTILKLQALYRGYSVRQKLEKLKAAVQVLLRLDP